MLTILIVLAFFGWVWHLKHTLNKPADLGEKGAAWSVRLGSVFAVALVVLIGWMLIQFIGEPVNPNVDDPLHLVKLSSNISLISLPADFIKSAIGVSLGLYVYNLIENSKLGKRSMVHPLAAPILLGSSLVAFAFYFGSH